MKLAILGLSGILLLSGCSSSPSVSDQVSLIEYEACLTKLEKVQQEARKILADRQDFQDSLKSILTSGLPDEETGLITSLEKMIENCAKYRP
jgi:hypothetical protein